MTPSSTRTLFRGLQSNFFDEYRIEGKDETNQIYLELNVDQLSRALKSTLGAQVVKIKLTKKQGAFITVEIVQVGLLTLLSLHCCKVNVAWQQM